MITFLKLTDFNMEDVSKSWDELKEAIYSHNVDPIMLEGKINMIDSAINALSNEEKDKQYSV